MKFNNETEKLIVKLEQKLQNVKTFEDLVELERLVLDYWKKINLDQQVLTRNTSGQKFSFFDGPITANNPMGVHHAWGRTYKDVMQRFMTMHGYNQRYQNGFDTQGLWVEVEVEKSLGFNSKKELEEYGLEKFANACKKRVYHFAEIQTHQSQRLGQFMDWRNSYFTHSDKNVETVWHFLKKCHERGWLYKKSSPVPWCWRCGTTLSQHEQSDSYRKVTHLSPYVLLELQENKNLFFLVWTTTPWTLPANTAVAVNPDMKYGLYKLSDGKMVYAALGVDVLERKSVLLKEVHGKNLVGLKYKPLFSEFRKSPSDPRTTVSWKEVSDDEGTGIVHLAPGCGKEDFELSEYYSLEVVSPLDEAGYYKNGFGKFSRIHYSKVNKLVLRDLQVKNQLFALEGYSHKYPHCWRCKEELVYRLSEEWFLSVDELRPKMQQVAKEVDWSPDYVGKLYEDWLVNMGDWSISRKRYWGLPLPFYPCACGHLNVVGSKEELLDNAVGDPSQLKELHRPWIDTLMYRCQKCNHPIKRIVEVGDCWLDAGVMPFSTTNYQTDNEFWKRWFPADFVCEMREQVRLWFYSMMFVSLTLENSVPFESVISYEEVMDKHGNPMHKSTGNAVWFDDAVEEVGADTLRLFYMSQSRDRNLKFDLDKAKLLGKDLLTVLNVTKFYVDLALLDKYQYRFTKSKNPLDRWLLSRFVKTVTQVSESIDTYDFRKVVFTLRDFVDDLSNWYLRLSRERMWRTEMTGDKEDAFATCHYVLTSLSKLIAPFTPFFAEILYLRLSKLETVSNSVHLESYPNPNFERNKKLEKSFEMLKQVVSLGKRVRSNVGIKIKQPLSKLFVWTYDNEAYLDDLGYLVCKELNVKNFEMVSDHSSLVTYNLLPNYEKLGPRLGEVVNDLRDYLNKLSPEEKLQWVRGNRTLNLNGKLVTLEDLDVRFIPKPGLQMATDGDYLVFLNTDLSDELIEEGVVREVLRHVQVKRKEMNLPLNVEVNLRVSTSNPMVLLLKRFEDQFEEQALCYFEFVEELANSYYKLDTSYGEIRFELEPILMSDVT